MPRPLRRTVARPLDVQSIHRKLNGEDRVDDEVMRLSATEVDEDTETKLAELKRVTSLAATYDKRREELRDELTPILADGSRTFVGPDGGKYYGYNVVQESTIVDVDLLRQLVDPEVFAEVVTDKVDLKAFKTASNAGRIPPDVLVKVVRFRPKAPYVKFGQYAQ